MLLKKLGHTPLIIAHRGGAGEASENTVASVQHGVDVGSDCQEIDVTLSADDVVVVMHDDTLNRTTSGTGFVADYTAYQLQKFVVYPNEPIPTLQHILAIPGAQLMIELKAIKRYQQLAKQVVQLMHDHKAHDRVIIGSFCINTLSAVYQIDASLPLIGIVDSIAALQTMLQQPVVAVAISALMLHEALPIVPAGIAIWVWTVNSTQQAQDFVKLGVHGIITDVPQKMLHSFQQLTKKEL